MNRYCTVWNQDGAHQKRPSIFVLLGFETVLNRSSFSSDLYYAKILQKELSVVFVRQNRIGKSIKLTFYEISEVRVFH